MLEEIYRVKILTKLWPAHREAFQSLQRKESQPQLQNLGCSHLEAVEVG